MTTLARIYLLLAGFLIVHWSIAAASTRPYEGDSLAYHLPIARNILEGKFAGFERADNMTTSLLQYYPASSHLVLAAFMALGIEQWFNLAGIVAVGAIVWLAGKAVGLDSAVSTIAATTVATLTSAIRLVPTQTIDLWLLVWYGLSLWFVMLQADRRLENNWRRWLIFGAALGMLIGTKYTGPFFAAGLFAAMTAMGRARQARRIGREVFLVGMVALVVGGGWYLRNLVLFGDPFYPSSHPAFHLDEMYTWQNLWREPALGSKLLESLISEFSWWWVTVPVAGMVVLAHLWKPWRRRLKPTRLELSLAGLTVYNALLHFLLPAAPVNMLSDLRYALPTLLTGILLAYLLAVRFRRAYWLGFIGLVPLLSVFTLGISHQPKLFAAYTALVACGLILTRLITQRRLDTR